MVPSNSEGFSLSFNKIDVLSSIHQVLGGDFLVLVLILVYCLLEPSSFELNLSV